MLIWRQGAARTFKASLSLKSSRKFLYDRFSTLESSRTLSSRVVGQTIWYTWLVPHNLVSSGTTGRVCVVSGVPVVQPISALRHCKVVGDYPRISAFWAMSNRPVLCDSFVSIRTRDRMVSYFKVVADPEVRIPILFWFVVQYWWLSSSDQRRTIYKCVVHSCHN